MVFNRTSETDEDLGLAATYLGNEHVVFGGFVIRGRPIDGSLDPVYSGYALRAPSIRAQIVRMGQGVIRANIGQQNLKLVLAPVPSISEQRAIAAALSDVDAVLKVLGNLIFKKRNLKQAAMQQLLSGKKRLPGFKNVWEMKSLNLLTTRSTGVWGKNEADKYSTRRVSIIRAGDISQEGKLVASAVRYISPSEYEKAKCELDQLVITTSGNGLGKVWWCDGRCDIAASNFVRVIKPHKEKVLGKFLYYMLRTNEGLRQLQEHTATSAYPNLRPTYFSTVWIPVPPLPEQTAIAAALSDMDNELDVLEARLSKTHAIKQAMTQELLTGKTRLIPTGASHA